MKLKSTLLFLFLWSFSFSLNVNAQTPEIETYAIRVPEATDLEEFLTQYLSIPHRVLFQKGYLNKIHHWNPWMENSTSLEHDDWVYVEIPYGTPITLPQRSDSFIIAPQKTIAPAVSMTTPTQNEKTHKQRLTLGAYYLIQIGQFNQEDSLN